MELKIEWYEPKVNTSSMRENDAVRISASKSAKSNRQHSTIYLKRAFMKKVGWLAGDRVMVGTTGNHIALRRTTQGNGLCLSAAGVAGKKRESLIGTTASSVVKVSAKIVRESKNFTIDQITIMEDGTVLIPN